MTVNMQVIERISQIVRDRGDVELVMLLDRIMDYESEEEQAAGLAAAVKQISQKKKGT
jgi:3-hydroxymyristoyl/3-hydroxydecanoyl-(acyl carrier protein) dehydratase